jgi:hypothetical protein
MGITFLDVLPEEAHRKDILRQAEERRFANRALRSRDSERRSLGAIRLTVGRLLVNLGRSLQNQAGLKESNTDVVLGLK